MIKIIIDQYKKERPKIIHHQQISTINAESTPKNTIMFEAERRNMIVKTLYNAFIKKFSVGDKVKLFGSEHHINGDIYIIGICKQYSELGRTEPWPVNNNPMIVSLYSEETSQTFHCTIGSITKT